MTNLELLTETDGKTAFVFAGGGSLGACQVGMLKALTHGGIRADMLVGASVGAINAAYFGGNPSIEGVEALEQVWIRMKRQDIFPLAPFYGFMAFLTLRNSFVSPKSLEALIQKEMQYKNLEDALIPVHVVATDAGDGSEVILSHGDVITALMASTAIPGIFPPVELGRKILLDGGVTNNTPILAAIQRKAERIIVFPTGSPCATQKPPTGAMPLMLHALNLMIISQLIRDIHYYGEESDIIVIPPLCPLSSNITDFSNSKSLIESAFDNTTKWLGKKAIAKGKVPAELEPHHH